MQLHFTLKCLEPSPPLWRQCIITSVLSLALVAAASAQVVINEVHYNSEPNTAANEFVELHNISGTELDLSGWFFSDGIDFTFPEGTTLPAAGFLVVAERPNTLLNQFGVAALGPFQGGLSGRGERIALSSRDETVIDEVDYRIEFPWPVAADGSGASMELSHPALDNDLGGSWRSSRPEERDITYVSSADPNWSYRHGTNEASSPMNAWRAVDFVEDDSWLIGQTPIGYGRPDDNTALPTMRNAFSTLYLRHRFTIEPGEVPLQLLLRVYVDDGAIIWINGVEVARLFAPEGDLAFDALGIQHAINWEEVLLDNSAGLLVEGENIITIHALNALLDSPGFSIDAELRTPYPGLAGAIPTPGLTNSTFTLNPPPQIRQVDHSPQQPAANKTTLVSAKVTDPEGVASVSLEYQTVAPGAYIPAFLAKSTAALLADPNAPLARNPAYHDPQNWTSIVMLDDGTGPDEAAGDGLYSVELPGQTNRTLVRYRITVEDNLGATVRVPYDDDESLNFAYFVYDGVPDYVADTRSIFGAPHTHPAEVIRSIPVYHVLVRATDFSQAVAYNSGDQIPRDNFDGRTAYNWTGTFVYDGKVYDNIGYRLRQRNARYALSGKRSFKFRFHRGRYPQFHDMQGDAYARPWRTLSTHKMISSRNQFRTWGLYQAANHLLWNMTGTPASFTHWFHLRVVQGAEEAPTTSNGQYFGDFYGMLLAMEEFDVDFLNAHNLEKGNLYKLISGRTDGVSVRRYLQPDGVDDGSDFQNIIFQLRPAREDEWLHEHVNYDQWNRYHAIIDAVRHYDFQPNTAEHLKNRAYYFEPVPGSRFGRLQVFPWDSDTSWGPNWNGGVDFCKFAVWGPGGNTPRQDFIREYKNVVREIRDLVWTEEQINLLLDPLAARIADFVPADRDRWTLAPASAGFQSDPPIESVVADMKRFAFIGGSWVGGNGGDSISWDSGISGQQGRDAYLDALSSDPDIPATPQVVSTGPSDFPVNKLIFQAANYSGTSPFAAWKWRIAEITSTNDLPLPRGQVPKFEIVANWESEEITDENNREIAIPSKAVRVGRTYRVRLRAKDTEGRWSHWSAPLELVTGEPDSATAMLANLKVTELMYHAPLGNEFDFVELHNADPDAPLDVSGAKFTAGIDFILPPNTIIGADGYLLVIANPNAAAFRTHYGLDDSVAVSGPYERNFSNAGEQVTLRTSAGGTDIASFTYRDSRGWPLSADGSGHSLIPMIRSDQAEGSLNYGRHWRASTFINGSPGKADPARVDAIVINEVAANTDFAAPAPQDSNDWIELHNTSTTNITLDTGWYLSDDNDQVALAKWMIPAGTVIPAGGFVTFDEQSGFHSPFPSGFGLNKAGEQVLLSFIDGTDQNRVVDSVRFKAQEPDWSWARYPDGDPYWYPTATRTRDAANATPANRVVISEIMYHPPDLEGFVDNNLDEFVEIYNPTAVTIELFDTNGTWRLDGTISYQLPPGISLQPMSHILIVKFNPTNSVQVDLFRETYGITEPDLVLLGPYEGVLANSSQRVAVEKPQPPDQPQDTLAWVIVDEVIYADRAPWPQGADGSGASLQRLDHLNHGNDPANWQAAIPTPNGSYPGGAPPMITIHPAPESQIVAAGDSVTYAVTAVGNPPLSYQWLLNNRAIPAATNETYALDFALPEQSGEYQAVVMNAAGSTLSQPVRLRVTRPPRILTQPSGFAVRPGAEVTFSVFATGAGNLEYSWSRNGTPIADATNAAFTITNIQGFHDGTYTTTITDTNGVVVSNPAQLIVLFNPGFAQQPQSLTVVERETASFSVVMTGTRPFGYRWRRNGRTVVSFDEGQSVITITNVQPSDAGRYSVVVTNLALLVPGVLSRTAILTVLADTDADRAPDDWETLNQFDPENPADGEVDTDLDGLLNWEEFVAGTDPRDPLSVLEVDHLESADDETALEFLARSNLTYTIEWKESVTSGSWAKLMDIGVRNTNRIERQLDPYPGTESRLYRLVTPQQAEPIPHGPIILTSPQPDRPLMDQDVQLNVFAIGQGLLRYQWHVNQIPVPGATGPNLLLSQVQPSQTADYTVTITDDLGSTTSLPARLTVLVPPLITAQPQNQIARPGDNVSFNVSAVGNDPLSYFWMHNGQLLREEKSSTLNLVDVQPDAAGTYAVFVRHLTADGPVTAMSSTVILRIVP